MNDLTYKRMLTENDLDIPKFISIFELPEVARYLSVSDNYFRYVTTTENVYFYKVYKDEKLIGSTHIEKQGSTLFMDILVLPEFQKMGLGTKIVKDIQNDVFGLGYEKIEISIDERNVASLRLFENAGFKAVSKDGELINYIYDKS